MSVSRVVFGTLIAACAFTAIGCNVSIQSKTRWVNQGIVKTADTPWAGGPISINIAGAGVVVNGGVHVTADPAATTVTATANFVALAIQKPDADLSIADAVATFNVTTDASGTVNVVCDHGQTHGGSTSGESGCEVVTVTVPAGAVGKALTLQVLSGNGDMTLDLGNATITNLGTNANGTGNIVATLPATQGGSISLVSQQAGDITATLPQGFSSDEVILQADPDKIHDATGSKLGAGAGGVGTAGVGLKSLKLTSTSFAGSTGVVTLN